MGSHNVDIYSEHLTTFDYAKDGCIFFSLCCKFSNARAARPWGKHEAQGVKDRK